MGPYNAFVEEPVRQLEADNVRSFFQQGNMDWPAMDQTPLSEFRTEKLASMCFLKLFPLGEADPTNKVRLMEVSEQEATAHLLRYAELDPISGEMYYPFAEHERFMFWMNDRIRRCRSLSQTRVYLKKNPGDAALSVPELRQLVQSNDDDAILRRLTAYSGNLTGSPAYWQQRRSELLAICEQMLPATVFFTLSAADNHWYDLHRLMPSGMSDNIQRRVKNASKNSHLVDWFVLKVSKIHHLIDA
jgi:hypothetical protein